MEREAKLEKSKFYFIDYVRAFAAIIIINSHFDSLYPVPVLATGGAIGNALFFAVSGFCLWPIKNRFGSWYAEKIIRLYIPTLIMTLISIVLGTYSLSLQEYIFIFIWPTLFWFIGAIILFYPLYYFIQGVKKNWHFALLFFILFIVYFLYYFLLLDTSVWTIESGKIYTVNGFFRLIYYFVVMMIGKYFRINVNKTRRYPVLYILYIFIGGGVTVFYKVSYE